MYGGWKTLKPSDLMLIIFVSLFCSVALYFIYNIIADAKESVDSQLQNNDFMSECNCIQVLSSSNDSIVIENIGCDYIFDLKIIFPDSNYSYQKTIKKHP